MMSGTDAHRRMQDASPTSGPASARITSRAVDAMRGDLADYPLAELLQFLHSLRKDGQLVIEREDPPQSATLGFVEGRLVDAYSPPLEAEECVCFLLTWRRGRFMFLNGASSRRESITCDLRSLILDGMRRVDELQRVLIELPPPETVLHRNYQSEALTTAELNRAHWRLLERIDSQHPLSSLLGMSLDRQSETATALARLLALGLVTTTPDDSFLDGIVLRASEHLPGIDDEATQVVLQRLDGRTSLSQVRSACACSTAVLIDVVQYLADCRAIDVVSGHDELARAIACDALRP